MSLGFLFGVLLLDLVRNKWDSRVIQVVVSTGGKISDCKLCLKPYSTPKIFMGAFFITGVYL
jgi:hypothetical protein